jgi:hypothetical protein
MPIGGHSSLHVYLHSSTGQDAFCTRGIGQAVNHTTTTRCKKAFNILYNSSDKLDIAKDYFFKVTEIFSGQTLLDLMFLHKRSHFLIVLSFLHRACAIKLFTSSDYFRIITN